MSASFHDHFSRQAAAYRQYRPVYPAALYAYLASQAPSNERAWDCATGSGQAALGLAVHFTEVVATDASARQLAHAAPHDRVHYRHAPAEHGPLSDTSVDLVTVAQALHWFDVAAFNAEAARVLKPSGVLAVWTYALMTTTPAVDAIVDRFYREIVGPFWTPERRHVETGYRDLPFPFPELDPPRFDMTERWPLDRLRGYLRTWSAAQRYQAAASIDPLTLIDDDLRRAWGAPETERTLRWPLTLRVGRKP